MPVKQPPQLPGADAEPVGQSFDIVFIDAVPKTSVGKFNKRALRERFKDYASAANS